MRKKFSDLLKSQKKKKIERLPKIKIQKHIYNEDMPTYHRRSQIFVAEHTISWTRIG